MVNGLQCNFSLYFREAALHIAARNGDEKLLKALLEKKADLKLLDRDK